MQANNLSVVITAPSGAGKTTMIRALLPQAKNIVFSISSTTRPKRPEETEGVDYFFTTKEDFLNKVKNDEFIEWAEVHGNFYGTLKKEIDRIHKEGKIPLFDVDIQGSKSLKDKLANSVFILILPPSLQELENRLKERDTEPPEQIKLRLENAIAEISEYKQFDYVLINDNLPQSVLTFKSIISAELSKTERMTPVVKQILEA